MNEYNTLAEFYPTPPELAAEMLKGIKITSIKSVLDPSAGKGDLLLFFGYVHYFLNNDSHYYYQDTMVKLAKEKDDRVTYEDFAYYMMKTKLIEDFKNAPNDKYFRYDKYNGTGSNLHSSAIELNPTLRDVLKGREFNIVGDDFLVYDGDEHYDFIIMNPPFSNGDEHLLKAIDFAEKTGSKIVCLLNAETIKNPYSNKRKLLAQKLKKYNAEFQYITDGFVNAERETDVETVIVRLDVPSPFDKGKSRIVDELEDFQVEFETQNNDSYEIVTNDYTKQAVLMYKREIEYGKRLIQEYLALKPYITRTFQNGDTPDYAKGSHLMLYTDGKHNTLDFNEYVESVRYKYWYELLHEPAFMENLTSNLRSEYFEQIRELAKKDFSLSNIYSVKIDMLKRVATGIEEKIVSIFEKLSYEHSMGCEGNIHYFSGWKSNSAFIINKKVVVPYMNCWNSWKGNNGAFDYHNYCGGNLYEFITDVEKCLDFLDGGETDIHRDIEHWLRYYESTQETKNLHFKYFDINVYKKGTVHIKFTNPDVLKKLNIYGCLHKGWLPPVYGKKHYRDMTQEEKTVIDGFEGEQEYEKVFAEKDRYIVAPEKNVLMIEATVA